MKNTVKSIETVAFLVESVKQSLDIYEKETKAQGLRPYAGSFCGSLTIEDSKESIKRRITVIREELLKISKSL